jgi:PhnB protein
MAKKKSTGKATKKSANLPAGKAGKKAKKAPKKKATRKASKKAGALSPSKGAPKKTEKFTSINPYLTFNGTCEAAFNFYKSIFGGKFGYIGRYKDMPPQDEHPIPTEQANYIMHVSLPISKETTLMGADSSPEFGGVGIVGNNISISVNSRSKNEADRIFKGLSNGGRVNMPMSDTFWGSYFGMCTDKFGINWMMSWSEQNMM